jgi:hypothetical protein
MAGFFWFVATFEFVIALLLWEGSRSPVRSWRIQDRIAAASLLFNFVAFVGVAIGAWIAYNAFMQAKRQADVAEFQLDVARDMERRQLRAYIAIDTSELTIQNNVVYTAISLRNSGQTPAYDLIGWFSSVVQPSKQAFIVERDETGVHHMSSSIVGPGTHANMGSQIGIPNDEMPTVLSELGTGASTVYAWGEVHYRDAFGEPWCLEIRTHGEIIRGKWNLVSSSNGNKESKRCPYWPTNGLPQ